MENEEEKARTTPETHAENNREETRTIELREETRTIELREETRTIELREERLQIDKRFEEVGEVRIHKDVVTEHRMIEVPVRREEVIIERHPAAQGQRHEAERREVEIGEGEEIRIRVREEKLEVRKESAIREEVVVSKRVVEEMRRVEDNLRREELHVDQEGNVSVRGREAAERETRPGMVHVKPRNRAEPRPGGGRARRRTRWLPVHVRRS